MSKILIALLVLAGNLLWIHNISGQELMKDEMTKSIYIDYEKSHIEILGKTNINQFKCNFDISTLQQGNTVQVSSFTNPQHVIDGIIQLKVDNFNCDNSQMTTEFKELLKYKLHPYITVQVKKITHISLNEYKVATAIRLAGEEQKYTMRLNAITDNNSIHCLGKQEICISDFGLVAPEKFFGMVKVNENISINFYLVLEIK